MDAVKGANLLDHSALKHADDFAAVIEIACDAIERPTQNGICFPTFNSAKHLVEYFAARLFCTLAFVQSRYNRQTLLARELVEFGILSINRKRLMIFILARFAAVDEIFEHGQSVSRDINICENKMVKSRNKKVSSAVILALRGTSESERILHRLHSVVLVLNGLSCSEAARLYGDSARSVAYWIKRFEAEGASGLEEEARSGRPSKLTAVQTGQLRSFIRRKSSDDGPVTAKRIALYIKEKFRVELTVRQCRRILRTLRTDDGNF